jgi:hypothetical protein
MITSGAKGYPNCRRHEERGTAENANCDPIHDRVSVLDCRDLPGSNVRQIADRARIRLPPCPFAMVDPNFPSPRVK